MCVYVCWWFSWCLWGLESFIKLKSFQSLLLQMFLLLHSLSLLLWYSNCVLCYSLLFSQSSWLYCLFSFLLSLCFSLGGFYGAIFKLTDFCLATSSLLMIPVKVVFISTTVGLISTIYLWLFLRISSSAYISGFFFSLEYLIYELHSYFKSSVW